MTTAASASLPPPDGAVARELLLGVLGSALFGAAAGLGHGVAATLRGAWMSPALFVGGALLVTPPLYLASMYSEERSSAEKLIAEVSAVLGSVGVALLGLSAPAAFFSATLRTPSAAILLAGCALVVGVLAVRAVSNRAFARLTVASSLWNVFALALGLRLTVALSHHLPSITAVTR